jgi:hypothetical protein
VSIPNSGVITIKNISSVSSSWIEGANFALAGPIGSQGPTGPVGIPTTQYTTGVTGITNPVVLSSSTNIRQVLFDNSNNVLLYSEDISTVESVKTFVIDHPLDVNKHLVHACLEGPEVGVYYRGIGEITNNKFTIIQLPDYVSKLAYNFSIQITVIYDEDSDNLLEQNYTVSKVINNSFKVYGKQNGSFYWLVFGQRKQINVEPSKNEVSVKGDGPYKWI